MSSRVQFGDTSASTRQPHVIGDHYAKLVKTPLAKLIAMFRTLYSLAIFSASLRIRSRAGRSASKVPSFLAARSVLVLRKRPLIPSRKYAISAPWSDIAHVAKG